MHLGLTYENWTPGAQNETIGDFFFFFFFFLGGGVGVAVLPFEYYVVVSQSTCTFTRFSDDI